ncbi:MAG TPA: hypothetical protein VFI87_00980, partial [Hyphomicrobiaceae bacterium]|nr:hypothetical protein [Hyphomicrobiaceae bacterium]
MTQSNYHFCSLPDDRMLVHSLLPQISALSQQYAISIRDEPAAGGARRAMRIVPQVRLEGFLGCPLTESEFSERLRFID